MKKTISKIKFKTLYMKSYYLNRDKYHLNKKKNKKKIMPKPWLEHGAF